MKLSFTTLGCPDWSFEQIKQEAVRLGVEGIEVRGINGKMRAEEIPLFFPENLESTIANLRSQHLKLVGLGTSASFHDEVQAAKGLEEGKKAIDVCADVGIPAIRVFGDKIPDPQRMDETIALVGNSIAELCRYAEGRGVDVLLEVHGEFNTIETVGGVIECCKIYPNFGILWDIEHSDRIYRDNWRLFYEMIRPYLKHIHIKDHIRNADGTYTLCLIGNGDIPISEIVLTLEQNGYEGYYSLEWEKKWHPELPGLDIALPAYLSLMKKIQELICQ